MQKLGEVERSLVIIDLTVGPDGYGGWAVYVRQEGADLKEDPTDHGRQGSQEEIPLGWKGEETPEVLAGDGGPL